MIYRGSRIYVCMRDRLTFRSFHAATINRISSKQVAQTEQITRIKCANVIREGTRQYLDYEYLIPATQTRSRLRYAEL